MSPTDTMDEPGTGLLQPVAVETREGYRIWLRYADGVEGEVDLSHLAGERVFAVWNDRRFFERVYISEWRSIALSDEIELCPNALYMEISGKTPDEIMPLRGVMDHAEVSQFYGIVIRIDSQGHYGPCFHARYAEAEAAIGIRDLALLEGELPPRARALVLEWAAGHRDELSRAWERARRGEAPGKIVPLD